MIFLLSMTACQAWPDEKPPPDPNVVEAKRIVLAEKLCKENKGVKTIAAGAKIRIICQNGARFIK